VLAAGRSSRVLPFAEGHSQREELLLAGGTLFDQATGFAHTFAIAILDHVLVLAGSFWLPFDLFEGADAV
jgi:hypothetical protein